MPQAKFICNIKYYFLLHFGSYRPIDVQDCISEEALCKSSLINTHGMESQFITFIYTSHWFHFVMAYKHCFRILLMCVHLCFCFFSTTTCLVKSDMCCTLLSRFYAI